MAQMSSDDISKFMETYREIEESQAVTVKISHREAVQIVVNDLTSKYRFNVERGDLEWARAFETVLRYYMTSDGVDEIKGEATQ